jgi:hypothetical protein
VTCVFTARSRLICGIVALACRHTASVCHDDALWEQLSAERHGSIPLDLRRSWVAKAGGSWRRVFAGYETQKWLHGLWILEARSSPMKYDDTNDTYSPQFGQLAPAAPRGGLLLVVAIGGGLLLVVATSEGLDGDLFLPLLGQQEDVAGLGVMADEMCNVRSFTRTRVIEMRWQAHTLRETLASFVEERGTGELTKRMMAARVWDDKSELLSDHCPECLAS